MKSIDNNLGLIMPISFKAHQVANQFRQRQKSKQKAKQVYLNTLAVYAVNNYLTNLGIKTDLDGSESWDSIMQSLADIADLIVPEKGRLECRPALPNDQVCYVPPEVWENRIGYIPVQFDPELRQATILGYAPTVQSEELLLSDLRSLDDLIDRLSPEPQSQPVQLGQWLNDVVEAGWQALDDLFQSPQLAFNFRSGNLLHSQHLERTGVTARGKLIDFASQSELDPLALVVELIPTQQSELDILVSVCPYGEHTHLPPNLELMVLDEDNVAVMQAQSRNTERIQLEFGGQPGEQFSVRVVLGAMTITEVFQV